MDRFERTHVYNLQPKLVIYVRYVDDIGTVVDDDDAAKRMLDYLNSKHPTLQFEMELPDHNHFLPILDVKIKITEVAPSPIGYSGNPPAKALCSISSPTTL